MYTTIFIFLVLGGLGFPIPEELPILVGGMAGAKDSSFAVMFLVCYLGALFGDNMMYFVGRFLGIKVLQAGVRSPIFPQITPRRVRKVRDGMRRNRLVFFLICRHLFFLRGATFVVSGSLRIPYFEFLIADGLAAVVSVSLFLSLGYFLGERLSPELITLIIRQANLILLGVLAAGIVIFAILARITARNGESIEAADTAVPAEDGAVRS